MKSSLVHLLVLINLSLYSNNLLANLNAINVKGTASILKPEHQKLCVAHGCVWYKLPVCENLYRIAYEKQKLLDEIKKATTTLTPEQALLQDQQVAAIAITPVDSLVQELFHLYNDLINFTVQTSTSRICNYLTPALIGFLVGELYKLETEEKPNATSAQNFMEQLLKKEMPADWHHYCDLTAAINQLDTEIKTLNTQAGKAKGKDAAQKRKLVDMLKQKKLHMQSSRDNIDTKNIPSAQAVQSFCATLIQAHQTCLQQDSAYQPETVYCLLLAYLWGKANTRTELLEYYNSLTLSLGKEILTKDIDQEKWLSDVFSFQNAQTIKKKVLSGNPAKLPLEELILATFAQRDVLSILPPEIRYTTAQYQGHPFSDCGETMLRALFNLLCYNSLTRSFDTWGLEKLKAAKPEYAEKIDAIIAYYLAIKDNDVAYDSGKLHNTWAHIVSELPGVVYGETIPGMSKKTYNLSAAGSCQKAYQNFEAAITALTGCQSVQELCSYCLQQLEWQEVQDDGYIKSATLKYTGKRLDGSLSQARIQLSFLPYHFALTMAEEGTTKSNNVINITNNLALTPLLCMTSLKVEQKKLLVQTTAQKENEWASVSGKQRLYCCLALAPNNDDQRNAMFTLIKTEHLWNRLLLRAAYRLVPADDLRSQESFFYNLDKKFFGLLQKLVTTDTQKYVFINNILDTDVDNNFTDWITTTLLSIKDDAQKTNIIKKVIDPKKHVLLEKMVAIVLPSISTDWCKKSIIETMIHRGISDKFIHALDATIQTIEDKTQADQLRQKIAAAQGAW